MTISTTTNRVSYAGNGVTTAFSFPYAFITTADLVVLLVTAAGVSTTKTLTTDYTISGTTDPSHGYPSGGTVTMLVAPASGETLVVYRDAALTQASDFVENDPFPAEVAETAWDKLTMIAQRLADRVSRAFRLADSDVSGASLILATPEASTIIGWDATGLALQNYSASSLSTALTTPFSLTLLDDTTAAIARATLGTLADAAGNGMLARTAANTTTARTVTAGAGVAVTNGDGVAGNPTVALSMSSITATLGGDVALNNTGTYFDGPSVAQGSTGTWFVSGTVTVQDSAGAAAINAKLWDGTTVIATGKANTTAGTNNLTISLSGQLASPAGNLRISCNDATATTGIIKFNASGLSKDSTITATRIA